MKCTRWFLLGIVILIGSSLGVPGSGSSEVVPAAASPDCLVPLEDGRCLPPPVPADQAPSEAARPAAALEPRRPGVVVKRKETIAPGAFRAALTALGFSNAEALAVPRWWRIRVPPGQDPEKVAEGLRRHPQVEIAEVEREVRITFTPNDPYYGDQWNLPKIRAPQAWDLVTGTSSVWIAIVDTGVNHTHPDLNSSRLWLGWDFANNDPDPMDDHGHGTHVAGIVGANTNNGIGVAGVCGGCDLLAVKVLDAGGSGLDSWVADGIRYAADWGAAYGKRTIINLSLGSPDPSTILADAVSYAQSKGALIIAAAGNQGTNTPFYPAAYPGVIGVSATDSSDGRAWFSNYGSYVDIAAPGVSILSTLVGGYGKENGTSMAAPHIAGVAGLVWSVWCRASANTIQSILLSTATDLGDPGWDPYFGYGLVNAEAAVRWRPVVTPVPPPGPYRQYLPLVSAACP